MQELQPATLNLGMDQFISSWSHLLKANSWAPNTSSFLWHSIDQTFILEDADDTDLIEFFSTDMQQWKEIVYRKMSKNNNMGNTIFKVRFRSSKEQPQAKAP